MSDLSYIYKPSPVGMGLAFAFFAVCALVSLHSAMTNDVGLIINGLIRLDPGQATVFYWVLTVAGAIMSGFGLLGFVRAFTSRHRLILSDTSLQMPKSAFSDTLVTVSYARVKDLVRQQIKSQHFLIIHHIGGKATISASMLPSHAVFDEVCRTVTERVVKARSGT